MRRRARGLVFVPFVISFFSVLFAVNIVVSLFLCPRSRIIQESFETGFGAWAADADVPPDPNNPAQPVEWHITRTTDMPHSGTYSLEFFIDGQQDDGTIWIERKITVGKNTRIRIKITFQLYSEWESANSIAEVCAYANTLDPEEESDFAIGKLGPANQAAGWKEYEYTTRIATDSTGEMWIGLGINVLWETHMTYYIDDVTIELRSPLIF